MQISPDSHVEKILDRERTQYWGNAFGVSNVAFCKGDADACLALLKTRFRPVPATQSSPPQGTALYLVQCGRVDFERAMGVGGSVGHQRDRRAAEKPVVEP